jgi:hypothetical protein
MAWLGNTENIDVNIAHIYNEEIIIMEIHVKGSTCDSVGEIMGVAISVALVVHQL